MKTLRQKLCERFCLFSNGTSTSEAEQLRHELIMERRRTDTARATATANSMEALSRRAAPHLATLSAMRSRAGQNKTVAPDDILAIASKLEDILCSEGLEPTAEAGSTVAYIEAEHMIEQGTPPAEGEPVLVRSCGYRFRKKLLRKAVVAPPDHHPPDNPRSHDTGP